MWKLAPWRKVNVLYSVSSVSQLLYLAMVLIRSYVTMCGETSSPSPRRVTAATVDNIAASYGDDGSVGLPGASGAILLQKTAMTWLMRRRLTSPQKKRPKSRPNILTNKEMNLFCALTHFPKPIHSVLLCLICDTWTAFKASHRPSAVWWSCFFCFSFDEE